MAAKHSVAHLHTVQSRRRLKAQYASLSALEELASMSSSTTLAAPLFLIYLQYIKNEKRCSIQARSMASSFKTFKTTLLDLRVHTWWNRHSPFRSNRKKLKIIAPSFLCLKRELFWHSFSKRQQEIFDGIIIINRHTYFWTTKGL